MKIYYPSQYPSNTSPSQRFRIEMYIPYLQERGIEVVPHSFFAQAEYKIILQKGNALRKGWYVVKGFCRRLRDLFFLHHYDAVFVQREAAPLGPALFEWLYAKVWRKKFIYDFDDAIWMQQQGAHNAVVAFVKSYGKIKSICKLSYRVIAGNEFLATYAKQYSKQVMQLPTVVDNKKVFVGRANQHVPQPAVVWTGSYSTIQFLEEIVPTLQKVYAQQPFKLIVICNAQPQFEFPEMEYLPWSPANEVRGILQGQIGIMPAQHNEWALGKCGFKLIEYMSLGLYCIGQYLPVNAQILDHGKAGAIVHNNEEWEVALLAALQNENLRTSTIDYATEHFEKQYSIEGNVDRLAAVLKAAKN